MVLFIIAVILLIIAMISFIIGIKNNKKNSKIGGVIALIFALFLGFTSCIYSQEIGQVVVLRNVGGSIAGTSADAGFHVKAPWQDIITYDTRNNVLSFVQEDDSKVRGGSASGPHITINDKSGASATIDFQVNYSLDPSAAEELYKKYGTQENFVKSVCVIDARAIPRDIAGKFDTISILTVRGEFTNAIQEALIEKWANYGLIVEQVSVQNVKYPDSIVEAYSDAQSAEIMKIKAQNEQDTAKIEAETKIIQAQGESEANKILAESLTSNIVMYEYIQALKEAGQLFVVPSDSMPVINVE